MHMRRFSPVVVSLIFLAAVACGQEGTWTGNGLTPTSFDLLDGKGVYVDVSALAVSEETAASLPVMRDAQNSPFVIETAIAHIDRFELKLPEGETCGAYSSLLRWPVLSCLNGIIRINGPFRANLLTGEVVPSLLNVPLPLTNFTWVRAQLHPANPADGLVAESSGLAHRSVWVAGTYGDPLDGVSFELPVERSLTVQVAGPISQLVNGLLQVWLDSGSWLSGLSISSCVATDDLEISGDLLILENGTGACADLEDEIAGAIEGSGSVNTD